MRHWTELRTFQDIISYVLPSYMIRMWVTHVIFGSRSRSNFLNNFRFKPVQSFSTERQEMKVKISRDTKLKLRITKYKAMSIQKRKRWFFGRNFIFKILCKFFPSILVHDPLLTPSFKNAFQDFPKLIISLLHIL
jgi:hypothetical protein